MKRFIDADQLKAETERLMNSETRGVALKSVVYKKVISLITSLPQEQPEVDLETEFLEYWYLHQYDHRLRRQVMDGHGKTVLENVARHFYELGRTRKEK